MIPAFRILANDQDVTATMADRLLSLRIVDEDGDKADTLEIALDDRDARIAFPELEANLDVSLGVKGLPLTAMGRYAVDGISGEGPAMTLRITATAADMKGPIRAPKTRAWEGKTLKDIVAVIAAEAGLTPRVGASVAAASWRYIAQTAESDLNLLTRMAKTLDATAKPAGGYLIVQARGEGRSAGGDVLAVPVIGVSRLGSWRWSRETRDSYGCVEAQWSDRGAGQTRTVKRGSGDPVKRLRHICASEDEAIRMAEAELRASGRKDFVLSATMAGFEPGIMAGGSVNLTGLRTELNGIWHVARASHALGAGLITDFTARKAAS